MIYKIYIAFRIIKYAKMLVCVLIRETLNQNGSACLIVTINIW